MSDCSKSQIVLTAHDFVGITGGGAQPRMIHLEAVGLYTSGQTKYTTLKHFIFFNKNQCKLHLYLLQEILKNDTNIKYHIKIFNK